MLLLASETFDIFKVDTVGGLCVKVWEHERERGRERGGSLHWRLSRPQFIPIMCWAPIPDQPLNTLPYGNEDCDERVSKPDSVMGWMDHRVGWGIEHLMVLIMPFLSFVTNISCAADDCTVDKILSYVFFACSVFFGLCRPSSILWKKWFSFSVP